jgi:HK97 family phage major capsid protein
MFKQKLQAQLDAYKAKRAEFDALQEKGESLSDDDLAKAEQLVNDMKACQTEIERLKGLAESEDGARSFFEDPVHTLNFGADAPEQRKPDLKFDKEKAGTELVALGANGQRLSLDADGFGISEKQFRAICEPSYKRSFMAAVIRGKGDSADFKALSEGSDPGGGYLVPPDISNRIIMRKAHPTQILGNVFVMTTSRDKVMMPKFKYTTDDIYRSGVRIAWTGETGPSAVDTSLENWGMKTIDVYTGSFEVEAYRDMLEDAAFDIEALVVKEGQMAYALGLDDIVVNGSGVGRPAGILRNVGAADEPPSLNVGNPVTADKLMELVYGLAPQYTENAKFLCNRTNVYATLAQLKDSANNYIFGLFSNTDGGLARAREERLLGHQIIYSAFMPNGAAAANVGVFADFSELYTLVQRLGMTVEPIGPGDREMRRGNKVGWYFRFRVGGAVVQDRAGRVAVQS